MNEGTFNIMNNTSLSQIGVVSKLDVLNAQSSPMVDYKAIKNIYGGDFFNDIRNFGNTVWSGVKSAVPFVKNVMQVGKDLLPLVGLGEGGCKGSALVGGRRMRKKSLRDRLY